MVKIVNLTKEEISKLLELHIRPKRIFEMLCQKGYKPKNVKQIANYIQKFNQESANFSEKTAK